MTTELRNEVLCEGCHILAISLGSLDRPLMETVVEWREYRAKGGDRACVDCHLPEVPPREVAPGALPRPSRSNRLLRPFDAELLDTALQVRSRSIVREGGEVLAVLEVANGTGHRFPTAEPHRRIEVRLELLRGSGEVVASSFLDLARFVDLEHLKELAPETALLPSKFEPFDCARRPGQVRPGPD
jgi:hypothetical protein